MGARVLSSGGGAVAANPRRRKARRHRPPARHRAVVAATPSAAQKASLSACRDTALPLSLAAGGRSTAVTLSCGGFKRAAALGMAACARRLPRRARRVT